MHEDYLQQIWSQSRIPSPKLKLTDGTPITVKHPGTHNTSHSGPDFKEACVQFDNLEFHGAIEIHVNGSDWYKHKHHEDEAYNNVVLHVVYNNDLQIIQNGYCIPTLELKKLIDLEHFEQSLTVQEWSNKLPCQSALEFVDPIFMSSMKTKALIRKLNEKTVNFKGMRAEEVLYRLIASSFGMGINKRAFLELAEKLPWRSLRQLTAVKRKQLILVTSGCAQGDFSLQMGDEYRWHFKGTRPGNFPSARIPQFAQYVAHLNMEEVLRQLSQSDSPEVLLGYMHRSNKPRNRRLLSGSMLKNLLINAIVPFLFWQSEQQKREDYFELSIELLRMLPSENNAILRSWKRNGISAQNAFDSQGLIALDRYYCSLKKCLSCEVGLKALNRVK